MCVNVVVLASQSRNINKPQCEFLGVCNVVVLASQSCSIARKFHVGATTASTMARARAIAIP